jgi:hypothetical protein
MANEDINGYKPSGSTNTSATLKARELFADAQFTERYFSRDNSIRNAAIEEMLAVQKAATQGYYNPDEATTKAGKAQIEAKMRDKSFLERYQSDNPKIRGKAVDELNKMFYDTYGNSPVEDKLTGSKKYEQSEPERPATNTPSQSYNAPTQAGARASEVMRAWQQANNRGGIGGDEYFRQNGNATLKDRNPRY